MAYRDLIQNWKSKGNEPAWLNAGRQKAFEKFRKLGFPRRGMEAWKYINLECILENNFQPAGPAPELSPAQLSPFALPETEVSGRYVFINGRLSEKFSAPARKADVSVRKLASHEEPKGVFADVEENNPFSAINAFSFEEGFWLRLAAGVRVEKPLQLFFASLPASQPEAFYPRVLIELEAGAQADLILDAADLEAGLYFLNASVEIRLAEGSKLRIFQSQRLKGGIQFWNFRSALKEKSRFEQASYVSGGRTVRWDSQAILEGKNAFVSHSGLNVLSGASQVFQHVTALHHAPDGQSRQNFKNILSGQAQAEFNSLVHVGREARGSDTGQLDKNLLLSDTARVWSRPQLKIDTDDVKANHGAATGRLDQKELFYLQSRGLEKEFARFVLTFGFAEEILAGFESPAFRAALEEDSRQAIRRMTGKGAK